MAKMAFVLPERSDGIYTAGDNAMSNEIPSWYLSAGGKTQSGPFTAAQIIEAWQAGRRDPTVICWRQGMPEWLPLAQVEPFRAVVGRERLVRRIAMGAPLIAASALVGLLVVSLAAFWLARRAPSSDKAGRPVAGAMLPVLSHEKETTLELGHGVKLELVRIPAGSFLMGDVQGGDDESPVHKVTITKPFYLGKYEVTHEQWERIMGSNGIASKAPKNPVGNVSFDGCVDFLARLNDKFAGEQTFFRLPTEAEWEYACRAGSATRYCFGDDETMLGEYAWYDKNSEGKTHPVGQKKPNAWGLYDMCGNAYEWCADWYHPDYYANSPAEDPRGPFPRRSMGVESRGWSSTDVEFISDARVGSRVGYGPTLRVIRGGDFSKDAGNCRSAARGGYRPGGPGPVKTEVHGLGFRVCLVSAEWLAWGSAEVPDSSMEASILGSWHMIRGDQDIYRQLTLEFAADKTVSVSGKDFASFVVGGDYDVQGGDLIITFRPRDMPSVTTRDRIKKLTRSELIIEDEHGVVEEYGRGRGGESDRISDNSVGRDVQDLEARGDDHPKRVSVAGTLTFDDGEPIANAELKLFPSAPGRPAMATTDGTGGFSLWTFRPGDGAVPGMYTVTAVAYERLNPTTYRWLTLPKYENQKTSGKTVAIDKPTKDLKIQLSRAINEYGHNEAQ